MLNTNPAEAVAHLSTFDSEEFAIWTTVPRFTPKADRAEAFRLKALDHTSHAEGLAARAVEYNAKPDDFGLMVSVLLEGVTLRLTAATYCREMSGAWAFLRALENSQ